MPYWRMIQSDDGWIYIQSSDLRYWGEFAPDSQNPPQWYHFARQVTQAGAVGNFFKYVYEHMKATKELCASFKKAIESQEQMVINHYEAHYPSPRPAGGEN